MEPMFLRPHQMETLGHFRKHDRGFDLSEYGVGKSQAPVARLRELCPPNRALILSPNGTVSKWVEKEIPLWGNPRWSVVRLTGSKRRRWKRFLSPHHVAVMNYEGVLVLGSALAGKYSVLILDEPHRLKDPTGKISRAVAFLSQGARHVFGLTGSPLLEHPMDLYGVIRSVNPFALDPNFYDWRERLFTRKRIPGTSVVRWIAKPGTMESLKDLLSSMSIRHRRDEIPGDWPMMIENPPIKVELDPVVRRTYDKMEQDFQVFLDSGGTVFANNVFPRLQKLCQLTHGYIRDQKGEVVPIGPSTKGEALRDFLEEIRGDGPVVIWSVRTPDMAIAADILHKLGMPYKSIWSATSEYDRDLYIRMINARKIKALIAHPRCIGEGIDLFVPFSIRFSLDWSHLHYSQPTGRFVRMMEGHHRVVFQDIIAEDTVDEDILDALKRKKDFLTEVLTHGTLPRKIRRRGQQTEEPVGLPASTSPTPP